ncbi:IS110 family transposase [Pedobacter paludis]|uniref:IS110 family transposase n=1 Tax=Pedobacter paludis TaxID=2203212 RepID=A0A317F0C9_9SPHI|nr:transposase [Pedobacter paludis]PWS32574.1 IS110 family transposase [Pedobacter paludis]
MHYTTFIGIDVSKATIDVYVHKTNHHKKFQNGRRGFDSMISWIQKIDPDLNLNNMHVTFEHTGLYSLHVALFLEEINIDYSMMSALQIKRSLGITRGKNDKIDARRIAEYGYLYRETLQLTKFPSRQIMQLQPLLALRDRLVRQRGGFEATQGEQARFLDRTAALDMSDVYQQVINTLKEQIRRIDDTMKLIIDSNPELKLNYDLVTTIKGIGKTIAIHLIVFTHNFSRFSNWRKFACYAGIAPFENQSGTTFLGKTKVISLANKQMKKMLHLAALCASLHDTEMRSYMARRVQGGKSKMSVMNIIRNKMLARAFAVVARKTPYVDIVKYAA